MRRREFTALVGGMALSWPFAGRAQQTHIPKIGVLVAGTPDPQPFWTTISEGHARPWLYRRPEYPV